MNRSILSVVVLIALLLITATLPAQAQDAKVASQYSQLNPQLQYTGKVYSGGKGLEKAGLLGIRYGNHTDFKRIVLDFAQSNADLGRADTWAPAPIVPRWVVQVQDNPYRLEIRVNDCAKVEGFKVSGEDPYPTYCATDASGIVHQVNIYFGVPVKVKIFEVEKPGPARLVIDVQSRQSELINPVWVIQFNDIQTIEAALKAADRSDYPVNFNPSLLVVKDKFYVEQAFNIKDTADIVFKALIDAGESCRLFSREHSELPSTPTEKTIK